MTIHEAAESLHDFLAHSRWLVGVGVGKSEGDDAIFLYVTSGNHKELKDLQGEWEGFPVSIKATGKVQPAPRVKT